MGGADQWGIITAGLELIRRVVGREEGDEPPAFAMCSPLLLTRDGKKMGKSEKGAVFLDPNLTSPFDFYQYWLNDDDALVVQHLKWLTLMTEQQVAEIEAAHLAAPEKRAGQKALAFDLTAHVHGRAEAERQVRVADAAFGGGPITDPDVLETLYGSLDHHEATAEELALGALDYAVASGFMASKGEARRLISQGGLVINDARITDADAPLPPLITDRYLVMRSGKKRLRIDRRA
jgi:tyrosyl-tRNA synthetase